MQCKKRGGTRHIWPITNYASFWCPYHALGIIRLEKINENFEASSVDDRSLTLVVIEVHVLKRAERNDRRRLVTTLTALHIQQTMPLHRKNHSNNNHHHRHHLPAYNKNIKTERQYEPVSVHDSHTTIV